VKPKTNHIKILFRKTPSIKGPTLVQRKHWKKNETGLKQAKEKGTNNKKCKG